MNKTLASHSRMLQPQNWGDFQHYKDRSPPWIKLHRFILDDRNYMSLPCASKALAPLLWLLASESKNGVFDASTEELVFRLRLTQDEIEKGIKPLIDKGFFVDASNLLAEGLQGAIPEREGEREGEGEGETEKDCGVGKPTFPVCPHQEILALYAEILPELAQPREWNATRQKHLMTRWKFLFTARDENQDFYATDHKSGIAFFKRFFEYIKDSDFLCGRAKSEKPFVATLPWIVESANFLKILEGNYENRGDA